MNFYFLNLTKIALFNSIMASSNSTFTELSKLMHLFREDPLQVQIAQSILQEYLCQFVSVMIQVQHEWGQYDSGGIQDRILLQPIHVQIGHFTQSHQAVEVNFVAVAQNLEDAVEVDLVFVETTWEQQWNMCKVDKHRKVVQRFFFEFTV